MPSSTPSRERPSGALAPAPSQGPPLSGVRVVEVCDSIAGAHCGKLLAHMGAEVTKVEPPEGDAARDHGAFPGGAPDAETSALFLHLNANKRSATLNTGSATGRAVLDQLAAVSDVLVYDAPELSDAAAGADGLVRVAITPFGLEGPNAEYRASDLTAFRRREARRTRCRAISRMSCFPIAGRCGRGAIWRSTTRGFWERWRRCRGCCRGRGMARGSGPTCRSRRRRWRWRGRRCNGSLATTSGSTGGGRIFFGGIFPAADGHVILFPREDRHWAALCDAMERPDLAADPRFATFDERRAHRPEVNAVMRGLGRGVGEADGLPRGGVPGLSRGALRRRERRGGVAAASLARLLRVVRSLEGGDAGIHGAGLPAVADPAGCAPRGAAARRT